jgi:hypothetical protein
VGIPLVEPSAAYGPDGLQRIDHQPSRLPGWWVERPSLEYQHAFDVCAVEVRRRGGEVAVFANSTFYARELLKRLQGMQVRLFPVGNWSSHGQGVQSGFGPQMDSSGSPARGTSRPWLRSVVWAEPEWEKGQRELAWLGRMFLPGGNLYVISSSWLSRFLPEWTRRDDRPAQRRAGFLHTKAWLRRAGFVLEGLYGFHGPESILWGYTSRWMARLGRGDWADRCHSRMRAGYVVSGWQSLLAPVVLAEAKRDQ